MIELHRMHVGRGIADGPVTLFPVWIDVPAVTGIDWRPNAVAYREFDGGASVSTLTAQAVGLRPAIALDGDLAEGGWQTRMVARSVLLGAGQTAKLPVLCVEEGRWGGLSDDLVGRARRATPAVRAATYRAGDVQQDVWARVREFEQLAGGAGASASRSLAHHLDALDALGDGLAVWQPTGLESLGARPTVIDGQRGVIVGIGGRIVGAELFASTVALKSRWAGIIDAARLDARRVSPFATPAEQARRFARRLEKLAIGRDVHAPGGLSVALETRDERYAGRGIALSSPAAASEAPGSTALNGDERMLHLGVVDLAHPMFALAA